MKYRHPNDKKIILCAVTAFICLAAFIAVILRICLAADAPRILFLVFILMPIGFLMSTALLVRFCIERAKDKRNGVAENRPVFVLSKPEIACIIVLAVSFISFLISIVFMCYRGIIPDGVTAVLFLLGIAGYIAGSLWARLLFVKQSNERARQKYLQNAGFLQIPAEDVTRRPIEYNDEKGFKEFEEHTLKFFENIVYPQGFIDFLKKYNPNGGEGTPEKAESEPIIRYVERNGEYYEIEDFYPPDELNEINNNILYSADYYMQFRDILFFADDGSGHCHVLLDYGKGGEPTVKYLDDEFDIVWLLADNFSEFAGKIKECTQEQYIQLIEEYEKNKLKR